MNLYSKNFDMSDLEKIINDNNKKNKKLKAFVAWLALTIATMFGQWDAIAQTSASKDKILDQIEQTLKIQWWNYESLLSQRDALLKSYEVKGRDVIDEFVSTQKRDFEICYNHNEYWLQSKIKNISLILENDFGIDVQDKTPVQILSIALQVLSDEDTMSWLKQYTSQLSGDFDINFINAYGYIQSKYPNTWVSVNGTVMPNWELDGVMWNKTVDIILNLLNDWTFTVHMDVPDFVPAKEKKSETTVSTTQTSTQTKPEISKKDEVETPQQDDNQWSKMVEDDWNTQAIDLDDMEEWDHNEWKSGISQQENNSNVNQNDAPQDNSNNKSETKTETKPSTDDSTIDLDLDDYSFRDPIADIVDNMSWTLSDLEQNLNHDNLVNVSHLDVLNTVNSFKNDNLKRHVMYYLLKNDVVSAQKLLGMELDCDSMYSDYVAWKKLDKSQLQKMKKLWETRRFDSPETVLNNPNIPQDVKDVYNQILDWKIKTDNLPYSIVSKTDYRIYLFSADNHLLDRQNTILWADAWDQKNNPAKWIQTTPGGEYRVDSKWKQYMWKDFIINYGTHYIVLRPMENQYEMTEKYTMWIHWDFKWDKKRKEELYSENSQDHRASNWCINVDSDLFGEIYNHLPRWSVIYVTFE